jgi:CpeT protein
MKCFHPIAAATLALLLLSGCARGSKSVTTAEPAPAKPCVGCDLAELVGSMSGSFASTEQSVNDPQYFDIRLHMQPIWPQHTTETVKWLYVEQAMATDLANPYRQRIYRVTQGAPDFGGRPVFISEVWELPGNALAFAGAWKTPESFNTLEPKQLAKREGCEVFLTRIEPGVWEGSTVADNCKSTLRGATYAKSTVHIDGTGLLTWDQGFDAANKQVWGAVKGGYEFKRQPQ